MATLRPWNNIGTVVVAQWVEQSLPIPEVCSSNPVICKIYIENFFTVNCIEKMKIKKKRPGMAHLKNNIGTSLVKWNNDLHLATRQMSQMLFFFAGKKYACWESLRRFLWPGLVP